MSPILPLRCLFCQHLNPAGATFCNDCGGQLNLQPCNRCGAIDNRAARNCYKCGAEFTLPAAPGLDSLLAPAILDKELTHPTLNDAKAAGPQAAHPNHDLPRSPSEPQPVDEALSSEMAATATKSRRRMLVAILALLLVLTTAVVAVYLYDGQRVQLAQKQGEKQAATDRPGAPKRGGSTLSTGAVQIDSDEPEKPPSAAPPDADAARTVRPLPATDAKGKTRHDRPIVEKCPQAVATLGLCNPATQQEKH